MRKIDIGIDMHRINSNIHKVKNMSYSVVYRHAKGLFYQASQAKRDGVYLQAYIMAERAIGSYSQLPQSGRRDRKIRFLERMQASCLKYLNNQR
jgi:hypothetical protein